MNELVGLNFLAVSANNGIPAASEVVVRKFRTREESRGVKWVAVVPALVNRRGEQVGIAGVNIVEGSAVADSCWCGERPSVRAIGPFGSGQCRYADIILFDVQPGGAEVGGQIELLGEPVIVHRDASGAGIQPAPGKSSHGEVVFSRSEGGCTLEFRQGCGAAAEDPKDCGEKGVT